MAANVQEQVIQAQQDLDLENKQYQAIIDTSEGEITLDFLPDVAPEHVRNFLGLAKTGFYDNGVFHRVISGFMIQGGCPEGTGFGGPGYQIAAEFNDTPHEPGVLSMARSSDPNSAGSQFFICLARHPHLDGQYTAFGRTADEASLNVVEKIGATTVGANDKPANDIAIRSVKIVEK